jgi:subtilisin family serine protease
MKVRRISIRAGIGPFLAVVLLAGTVGPSAATEGWTLGPVDRIQRDATKLADASVSITTRHGGRTTARPSRNEVVVQFAPGTATSERAASARALGGRLIRTSKLAGFSLVKVPAGESVEAMAAALERRSDVAYAEPNYIRRLYAADPLISRLWGLQNTGQTINGISGKNDADMDVRPQAWKRRLQGPVKVAVIDSGTDFDHPDFAAGTLWTNPKDAVNGSDGSDPLGYVDDIHGWDFVENDNDPDDDCNGHGSHVAGTIAATRNNGVGIAGVSNKVKLITLRVALCDGSIDVASIAEAFRYANRMGAKVVNASFGGPGGSLTEQNAIRNSPGTLFVVAAGNAGSNNDTNADFPCDYFAMNILCVAATTQNDTKAAFSNFGRHMVDLGAPGRNVVSINPWDAQLFEELFDSPDGTTPPALSNWNMTAEPSDPEWEPAPFRDTNWELRDSRDGDYTNDVDSYASPTDMLDLSGLNDCVIAYYSEWFFPTNQSNGAPLDGDRMFLEVFDPVAMTWVEIDELKGEMGLLEGPFRRPPIPNSLLTDDVDFRFHMHSDASGTADGVLIDDVSVECDTPGQDSYVAFDGTSMAAPHASGAAALLWAFRPKATVLSVKNALLMRTDRRSTLVGKTVTGGRLNANSAMGLLANNVHPVRSQAKSDGNDVRGELDIKKASLGVGDSGVITRVTLWERWSSSLLKRVRAHDGLIDLVFDTDVDVNVDYVLRVDYTNGRLRGTLYRCTSPDCSTWTKVGSGKVTRPDGKTVQVKLSRSAIKANGSLIFWFAASGWGSMQCPTGCFDSAPNNGAIFDL